MANSELDLVLREGAGARWDRDWSASAVAVEKVFDRVTATLLKGLGLSAMADSSRPQSTSQESGIRLR
jgi:hypothetical protein